MLRNPSLLLLLVLAGAPQPAAAAQCGPAGDLSALEELLTGLERLMEALFAWTPPWAEPTPEPVEQQPLPDPSYYVATQAEPTLEPVQQVLEDLPLPEPEPPRGMSSSEAHVYQFYGTSLDCGPASALLISRLFDLESDDSAINNQDAMGWTPDGSNTANARSGLSAMRGLMGATATGTTSFTQLSRGLSALGAESTRVDSESTEALAERVEDGEAVILLGRPNGDAWPNSSVGAIDHFVVLSDYDADTDTFTVNDPAYPESLEVPSDQVEAFRNQSSQGPLAMTVSD